MQTIRTLSAAAFILTNFALTTISAYGQSDREKELIALLRSQAPAGEKALACKQLTIYGSSAAVPALAPLLSDPQLASWARIPLEAIPGAEADEALRKSLEVLDGDLLIGVINSIGVRKDAGSVTALAARLTHKNPDVAAAAAVALGHVGDGEATKALRTALATTPLTVRGAVAEGCVLAAERAMAQGRDKDAIEIFDEVRKTELPKQRVLEATRGSILARKQEGIPLLLELLRSSDKVSFQWALGIVREFPGQKIDELLAAELSAADPDRAALVIAAMADRKESVGLVAILDAAKQGTTRVRLAAVQALGRVGDASCLAPLLEVALDSDKELSAGAMNALASLPDNSVDKEILARLSKAEGKVYALLIELVGQRRIAAVATLKKALDHADPTVRAAALTSLGETVSPQDLSILIGQVVKPKSPDDRRVAQLALKAACVRMPDRESCAGELAAAYAKSTSETKFDLLSTLAAVGGTKSLQTMAAAAKSSDARLQDESTRLLGEWMTIDAAPVLLDLTKSAPGDKYRVRALRGYIRIARQFVMPVTERAAMCEKAFEASRQSTEQKNILEILKRYPSPETLRLAVKATQNAELKEEATQAVLTIAQKIGASSETNEILAKIGLEKVKLEILRAEYGSGSTQKDVTDILRKQASDSQLIYLESSNFNSSFGGDPTPGVAKKLKVQYRINGKMGEVTLDENALIVLPMPK